MCVSSRGFLEDVRFMMDGRPAGAGAVSKSKGSPSSDEVSEGGTSTSFSKVSHSTEQWVKDILERRFWSLRRGAPVYSYINREVLVVRERCIMQLYLQ